ncbi:MAG: MprA protease, GlyGly-CTERM protein-sorting domain-containing form [Verrucomicrobiales bacterium]
MNLIEGRAEDTNVDGILQGNDDQTLDEFNLSGLDDAGSIDETFIFSYTVPDGTTDLALVLNGVGAGGSERFELSGITVTGRTIPEPSGVVLALIGLAGFAIRRRR